MDFTKHDYLKHGTITQRNVYEVVEKSCVFSNLKEFNPVLVGTFPLKINIDSSDLDIACEWKDKMQFREKLNRLYSGYEKFTMRELEIDGQLTIVAGFRFLDYEFEIFGQNIPVRSQFGYRHMIIEAKILEEKGEEFRKEIINLKKKGWKTEPAFAKLLGLTGNPYLELLKFESC